MMRFVFACDSFKGTISSARAATLLAAAARAACGDVAGLGLGVADGGEGTVEAVVAATDGSLVSAEVEGPLGDPVRATYGLLPGDRAVIEMAAASGITLVPREALDPLRASTYGTGQLVLDALDHGAADVSLAIGGSATNDGGMGFARALGARFLDAEGAELRGCGADLERVASIDLSGLEARLRAARFHVMCDVDNPLVGERGATYVFGPQKGASPEALERLEAGMRSYATVLERTFGTLVAHEGGMGAAGGLGAAARLFLSAEVVPGVEWVLDLVGLDDALEGAALCVTGEGHADAQSAHGKVISGVAARCRAAGVPCVAIVGGMDADATELLGCGVGALVPTVIDAASLSDVLAHAEENFVLAARRTFSLLSIGRWLGGERS